MTLPAAGPISASDINVELGRAATDPFDINGAAERALAGVPAGAISFDDFHGKSAVPGSNFNGAGQMTVGHLGTVADPYGVKLLSGTYGTPFSFTLSGGETAELQLTSTDAATPIQTLALSVADVSLVGKTLTGTVTVAGVAIPFNTVGIAIPAFPTITWFTQAQPILSAPDDATIKNALVAANGAQLAVTVSVNIA